MFNIKTIIGYIVAATTQIAPVAAVVQENIDAKTGPEKEAAILDAVNTGLQEVTTFDPSLIKDPVLFNKGIVDAHAAFDEIKAALGK